MYHIVLRTLGQQIATKEQTMEQKLERSTHETFMRRGGRDTCER